MHMYGKVHCGGCQEIVKPESLVIIGDFYTVAHEGCFHLIKELEMDRGYFENIAGRYLGLKATQ